jgi:hypothetical protein
VASSFASQIPVIVHLLTKLQPRSVLDVGKGFGKYGFLLHEYCGVDNSTRPNPALTLSAQSRVTIDCVECNPDFLWPHLSHLYRQTFFGRIESLYNSLPNYDVVLMADVIEHLTKEEALPIVRHFVDGGSSVIVSSPRIFFEQDLFESPDERHLSHWTPDDFRPVAVCDYQNLDAGRVFLLSAKKMNIRGFGHSPIKRLRRVARKVRDELLA